MRLCSIEDCTSKHMGRGWCSMHYKRWMRLGDPSAEVRIRNPGIHSCTTPGCESLKSLKAGKGMCITCYNRAYRATRRDELVANYKAWRKAKGSRWASMSESERIKYRAGNARRRAIRRGAEFADVTHRDIEALSRHQRGLCVYCQIGGTLTIEHILPLAAGGAHSIGNLALACEPCNKSKGSATVTEWKFAVARGLPIPRRLYDGRAIVEGQVITA